MKNLIIIISVVIFITSCKKTEITYSVSGQILPCSGYNNSENYELIQKIYGFNSIERKVLATIKTDINGFFNFTYGTNDLDSKLIIRQKGGFGYTEILNDIEVKNLTNLVIGRPIYHLIISLNVIKPYTNFDTLFIRSVTNANPINFKISGPFISGRLISKSNLVFNPLVSFGNSRQVLDGGIKTTTYTEFLKEYDVPMPTKCSGDSVFVTLDIK